MRAARLSAICCALTLGLAACSDSNDDDDDDTPGDEPSTGVTTPITNSGYGKYPHGWDGTLTRTTADGKIAGLPNDLSDQWGQGETDTWDGTTDISWYGPSPLQAYHIKTAEQLAGLGVLTAMGITFEGETIKLDVNIILNERIETDEYYTVLNPGDLKPWTPIEDFAGTFDGCGHVISGLYINSTKDNQALFGTGDNNNIRRREVWNLGIVNSYVNGGEGTAGILGKYWGHCLCCFNTGIVVSSDGASAVGGDTGAFCFNKGVVIGYDYIELLSCNMYYSYNAGILMLTTDKYGYIACHHNFYNLYIPETGELEFNDSFDYKYSIFEEGKIAAKYLDATFKDNTGVLTVREGSKVPGNTTTLIDALNNYEANGFEYARPDIVWKVDPERNNGYPIFTQDIYTGK